MPEVLAVAGWLVLWRAGLWLIRRFESSGPHFGDDVRPLPFYPSDSTDWRISAAQARRNELREGDSHED